MTSTCTRIDQGVSPTKAPGTYKEELCSATSNSMSQPSHSIQQYLDNLANPAMSDSLHSSTDTLVNPDTPTQPFDTIRQEDLSNIPLSLQLAFAPRSHTPITTERPNTIAPRPQYPNLFTYRSPQHPCGLAHEGPCPVPINNRLDYDAVKDAITELDIQTQAQAPPQTGPHSYHPTMKPPLMGRTSCVPLQTSLMTWKNTKWRR